MAFSLPSLKLPALFSRKKAAQDPFGGDDDEDFFDDDGGDDIGGGRNVGHLVAIGLSGVMSLAIVGFVVTAIMTADETAGPVSGSMPTEISQVVSEDGEVLEVLTPPPGPDGGPAASSDGPVALPGLSSPTESTAPVTPLNPDTAPVVSDTTTETDRSISRRPWLATDRPDGDRLVTDTDTPPGRAGSMDDLLRQAREGTPAPARPAVLPPADAPSAPAPMAANDRDDSVAAADMDTASPDTAMRADGEVSADEADAEMADAEPAPLALPEPELVPGAQRRTLVDSADTGPASVGGAPRLAEPVLPPTDSRAISAAPPRFTTLPAAEQLAFAEETSARVAIIVEGLGLNQSATEAAITSLPSAVTLSFSPYARDLQDWLQKAADAGHEVLVEVPLESKRFPADDPGPLGLLVSLDQIQMAERLSTILDGAEGSAGVLDVTGSRFRESAEHINLLFNNLDARGLFYVQGRPGLRLGDAKVPTATADIVLDERAFRASIDARLDYIERLAKYQGSSVAVASAKPVTFERLALWLDDISRRGVSVAPVSQVLIQ